MAYKLWRGKRRILNRWTFGASVGISVHRFVIALHSCARLLHCDRLNILPLTCGIAYGNHRSIVDPFTPEQVDYLARYLAKTFISRTDVKARQLPTRGGGYVRVDDSWKMKHLREHINGEQTYGHYLLDEESNVKIVAFDIDLEKIGLTCDYTSENINKFVQEVSDNGVTEEEFFEFNVCNPREVWLDHGNPGRAWIEEQMRMIVDSFFQAMYGLGGITPLATYSGSKGAHVYGIFTDKFPAGDARDFAVDVVLPEFIKNLSARLLAGLGDTAQSESHSITTSRGKNFYKIENPDGLPDLARMINFSIEIFPKQSHIEPMRLGNLMRLEFGKNNKAPDEPTFVIDMKKPGIAPHDTFEELKHVLETGNHYQRLNEKVKNDNGSN